MQLFKTYQKQEARQFVFRVDSWYKRQKKKRISLTRCSLSRNAKWIIGIGVHYRVMQVSSDTEPFLMADKSKEITQTEVCLE